MARGQELFDKVAQLFVNPRSATERAGITIGFKPSSRLKAVAYHADEKEGNCEHPTIML